MGKLGYILVTIGAAALLIYIFACVYLYFVQAKMIFLPTSEIEVYPDSIGLAFEEVNLLSDNNVSINGWYIPAEAAIATVLFFHGNGGNISHRLETIQLFNSLDLNVLIIDYRGYGKSDGSPSEKGVYKDAMAAWNYLVNDLNQAPNNIVIVGRSLGGGAATELAQKVSPAGLIVESSFRSAGKLGQEMFPIMPVNMLIKHKFDSESKIGSVDCPVLIVHSADDEMIPFGHGKRLFDAAKEPKTFLEISGYHNDGFLVSGQKYEHGLKAFIDSAIGQANE